MSARPPAFSDELQRQRLLDIERRMRRPRALAFGVLLTALLVCVPWIGWLWLIPASAAVAAPVAAARVTPRSRRPERIVAATWIDRFLCEESACALGTLSMAPDSIRARDAFSGGTVCSAGTTAAGASQAGREQ